MEGPRIDALNKKRKRTGKQREEAKKTAIQAKLQQQQGGSSPQPIEISGSMKKEDVIIKSAESSVNLEQLTNRIPQGMKTLHPMFKQAKTFEVRRLVKKIKFLRTKDDTKEEIGDLEAQLSLLSHIALHPLIQAHLLTKLHKHPQLKNTPFPTSITTSLTPPPSVESSSSSATPVLINKVENRLCSSKTVAGGVKNVVAWCVGEQGAKLSRPVKLSGETVRVNKFRNAKRDSSEEPDEEDENDGEDDEGDDDVAAPRTKALGESDSEDDLVQSDMAADAAGWESGSISDNDGDVQSELDAASDESFQAVTKRSQLAARTQPPTSISSKPVASVKATKQPKTSKDDPIPKGGITSSTFLPSLSTGFTLGDSDSDPDMDPDVDGAGIVGKAGMVRKNRRGQRARQAIWEKKFGKNANHVIKSKAEGGISVHTEDGWKGRSEGSARGVQEGFKGRGGRFVGGGMAFGRGREAPLSSVPYTGGTHTTSQLNSAAAIHPSWEAARLRKKREMGGVVASAAKPTKIVFD